MVKVLHRPSFDQRLNVGHKGLAAKGLRSRGPVMRDKCWFKFDKVKARVFLAFLRKKKILNSGCGHICDPSTKKTEAED